jgi:transaldolase / glucose-6-phosphate isomerase
MSNPLPDVQSQTWTLPADLDAAVKAEIQAWQEAGKVRRLWERDASLWTGTDEASWLGWLGLPEEEIAQLDHLKRAQEDARTGGFDHVLLLGMGGSSLCPEVLRMTFGRVAGFPELHVLDSTDPAQIRSVERRLDPARTLFIVSSKSGTTLEPNIFKDYFFDRVRRAVGEESAGSHFIAITDPRSKLQQIAEAAHFRHVYFGVPSVGGRYSALSDFGMVPGAIMGLDVGHFLSRAAEMATACSAAVPVADNPGTALGIVMGVLARHGRDKVTLIASPGIHDLGAWLEQLLAESTGKEGKGIVPVDREPPGDTAVYGADRLFVYLRLEPTPDLHQDEHVAALERAGYPVVRIRVGHRYDLGQEFFRWEFATAVAGSIIGINAFNQPDVEASKIATRRLTEQYERTGMLAPETPMLEGDGLRLYADEGNASQLMAVPGARTSIVGALHAHFARLKPGDYAAFLAYIEMIPAHEQILQTVRRMVHDGKHVATCLGFGPRFLHSTGQAYKGGPNSGVFLQITCDDAADLAVPGQKLTFGVVKAAQARGDFQVLAERARRALRVHLGKDVTAGLETLRRAIEQALA